MNLFPVFTRKLAYKLEMRGFKVVKIAPNKKQPKYNVYYFEDTTDIHDAFFEILREEKNL